MSVIQSYTINPVPKWNKLRKKDGTAPIWICLYVDKKQSFKKTSYRVTRNQWQEKPWAVVNHPNQALINASLKSMCSDIEKDIIAQNLQGTEVSRRILKVSYSNVSLSKYAKEVRGDNKITTKELNRIIEYFGSVPFVKDIDNAFLRGFHDHEKKRGMAGNTIHTSFKFLRRILREAKKDGLIKKNPLDDFLFPKYVQPDVTWLYENEKVSLLKLIDETLWPAKDTSETARELCAVAVHFLAACYHGLRHSDWDKVTDLKVVNNNLLLRAQKNKELVSLPVGKSLGRLLEMIKVLPRVPSLHDCNSHLKIIGVMAKIFKELTTHVGRHTFGFLCASLEIPRDVTAALMGIGLDTVAVYYHLTGAAIEHQAGKLRAV